jgi:IclR family pca regulon transcriptional regulator
MLNWNTVSHLEHSSAARWKFVNSLSSGLSILESLTRMRGSFSLSEITRMIHVPKTTGFRLLKTLCELDYLKYDVRNKKYSLGTKVLSLGFSFLQSLEICDVARPHLEALTREWDKSVNLLILDKGEMIYIERTKVFNVRELNLNIGNRIPLHNTAAGRAVLAYLDDKELLEIVKNLQENPDLSRQIGKNGNKLIKCLKEVRANGYAIGDEELVKGVRAIAVPVFSPRGDRYAINLAVASEIASIAELKSHYAPRLIKVADEISKAMGYRGLG